jgi:hypothetical protein
MAAISIVTEYFRISLESIRVNSCNSQFGYQNTVIFQQFLKDNLLLIISVLYLLKLLVIVNNY